MRLFGTKTSPYVRKVRIVAIEIGIADQIDYSEVDFSAPPSALLAANPTGRVPTLVADELVLFDSPVIAEWLDTKFGQNRLLPGGGADRWAILRTEALADGLLDSATLVRHETQRPEPEQSKSWIKKHREKVRNALRRLEQDDDWRRSSNPDLGSIAVACAVGYLALRFRELLEEKECPALLAWYEAFAQRPSMLATSPEAVS